MLTTTDPTGGTTAYTYDSNGNQTSVTDPDGNTTQFLYDADNRQIGVINPLGGDTRTFYDRAGNAIKTIDPDGHVRTYHYDAANRETEEDWLDSNGNIIRQMHFAYDANGNLIAACDPDSSYTFTYDALNRQLTADNGGTLGAPHVILTSAYDSVGNRTSVQDNSGVAVNSTYDAIDRLFSRSWSGGGINAALATFGHDANGNVTEISRFGDLAATQLAARTIQQYDANGRLTHIDDRNALDQVFAGYDYTLDPAGQLTQEIVNGQTTNYQYDQTGQLTGATSTAQPNEAYAYDANGNRTGGSNVVGANNQVTSNGTYNYAYDKNGNLIQKTELATGNVTTYVYDYRNRLTDVVQKSAGGIVLSEAHYTYDVFDRRIAQTVNGQTLYTVYDGKNAWADYNGSGLPVTRYLYGDGANQILSRWQPGQGTVWYLTDHLGSVRDLVNSAGALLDRIMYNSYGLVLGQTNAAFGDRFLYTGQQYDAATGLYYYIGRYYDPVTGRFISQDPLGFGAGDVNLYRYVGNHPTISTDPAGTLAEDAAIDQRIALPLVSTSATYSGSVAVTASGATAAGTAAGSVAATASTQAVSFTLTTTTVATGTNAAGVSALGIFSRLATFVRLVQTLVRVVKAADFLSSAVRVQVQEKLQGGEAISAYTVTNTATITVVRPVTGQIRQTETECVPGFAFGPLDELGRATEAVARISRESVGGPRQDFTADPPWWGQLPDPSPSPGWDRGHLLASELGGPGGRTFENLVPLYREVNRGPFRVVETAIRAAAEAGECIEFRAIPNYTGNNLFPDSVTITATGDRGFALTRTIPNIP